MPPQYNLLAQDYKQWLKVLNYSESVVKNYPKAAIELLTYLERQGITDIKAVQSCQIGEYVECLKIRSNKIRGGGISGNYINNILQGISLFIKYLTVTGAHTINAELEREPGDTPERTILTKEEISSLYKACDQSTPIGIRDKAMLAVYYGCGLRKSEGIGLDVGDILIRRSLLYVRKGKNYKERYVPITKSNMDDITNYLYYGRDWFLYNHYQTYYYQKPREKETTYTRAFFLNQRGQRMQDFTYRLRVRTHD